MSGVRKAPGRKSEKKTSTNQTHKNNELKMKHGLHIAAVMMAATAALTSCSDSYPGLEYTNGDGIDLFNSEAYDNVPIMVSVNNQHFFQLTATRGTGPFEEDYGTEYYNNKYDTAAVFVYAFRKETGGQGTLGFTDMSANMSRWAEAGNVNSDAYWGRDCLFDGEGHHGMYMRFTGDRTGYLEPQMPEETDGGPDYNYVKYYSKKYQEEPYNFFAYYLDCEKKDLAGLNPSFGENKISYKFKIDGSQDIMCGYAPFYTKQELKDKAISDTEINKILNIGGFSTYAASYGVQPTIKMYHQLVRLDFRACPGDEGADHITIKSIEVECNPYCELVVASKNVDEVGLSTIPNPSSGVEERENLPLKERSVDGWEQETELQPFKLSEVEQDGHKWWSYDAWKNELTEEERTKGENFYKIGSCLMVPQADEYKVILKFNQPKIYIDEETKEERYEEDGSPENDVTVTYTVKLQNGNTFEKGNNYPINITVYGFQKISVSANIEKWANGGDVPVIGEEDDMVWGK